MVLFVSAISGVTYAVPLYSITDLGTDGGIYACAGRINDLGQVVGEGYCAAGGHYAFLWEEGVITNLGDFLPRAINNRGQVVGIGGGGQAFFWNEGIGIGLGTGLAFDINDLGQFVGSRFPQPYGCATLWEDHTETNLGTLEGHRGPSFAMGINNVSQVVGYSCPAMGPVEAFLWANGVMTALGDHIKAAEDINDFGQIIGQMDSNDWGGSHRVAYLWGAGVITESGPGWAGAINGAGWVVGPLSGTIWVKLWLCSGKMASAVTLTR